MEYSTMRRSTALMSLAAVAVMASNAFAQAKPNFAGTWNLVQDPAAQQAAPGGRGGFGGGMGMTFTATQDDKTLTVTRTIGQNELKMTYNLDGSDSKNMMPGRGGNPGAEQVSKASWDGNSLVIKTTTQRGETSTKYTLGADGMLTIETTRPGQDGNAMTTKVQYKKG
jgi:hypothetical protein